MELNKNGSWHNKIDDRATLGCAEMCHLCSFRVLTDSAFGTNIPFGAIVLANTFPFCVVIFTHALLAHIDDSASRFNLLT